MFKVGRRSFLKSVFGGLAALFLPSLPKASAVTAAAPTVAAGIPLPLTCLPESPYIRGPRYRVVFDRITVPRFTKDVEELRLWDLPSLLTEEQ